MNKKYPNFFVIGAAKSGTTSLFHCLSFHPQIFLPKLKEPNYFGDHYHYNNSKYFGPKPNALSYSINDKSKYFNLFDNTNKHKAVGDVSPFYLYSKTSAVNIYNHNPNAKIIIILRNPVDRAFSHYLHLRRAQREPFNSFYKAVKAETHRIKDGWFWDYHYLSMGIYRPQLARYFNIFPAENIRLFSFSYLTKNLPSFLKDIFRFLDVNHNFTPPIGKKYNVSLSPKNAYIGKVFDTDNILKKLFNKLMSKNTKYFLKKYVYNTLYVRPSIDPNLKIALLKFYSQDIQNIEISYKFKFKF
jgi:hypothetical protein